MSYSFFALLFRQKYIKRWGLMRSVTPETLSDHTTEVAFIAHALANIGNKIYNKSYDPDRTAVLALFHDVTEVYTGDMPTPVKYFSGRMRSDYAEIEKNAAETLISKLPEEFREDYSSLLIADGKSESDIELHRLVKAADKLCAYIKCVTEENSGNPEFASAKKSIASELERMDCPELKYFMEQFLPSFSLTIDEMQSL